MIRVMIKESSKPQGAINESELGVSPELLVKGNTSGFKKFLKGITKFGTIPAIAVELLPARELYMNCRAAGAERSICTEMFWKRFGSQGFVEFEEELGKLRIFMHLQKGKSAKKVIILFSTSTVIWTRLRMCVRKNAKIEKSSGTWQYIQTNTKPLSRDPRLGSVVDTQMY